MSEVPVVIMVVTVVTRMVKMLLVIGIDVRSNNNDNVDGFGDGNKCGGDIIYFVNSGTKYSNVLDMVARLIATLMRLQHY